VDGLNNLQIGFPDTLPVENNPVPTNSYPICASLINEPPAVGKLVELECNKTVTAAAQYQYVIIQSLDTVQELLCIAEVGVYEPGQYAKTVN